MRIRGRYFRTPDRADAAHVLALIDSAKAEDFAVCEVLIRCIENERETARLYFSRVSGTMGKLSITPGANPIATAVNSAPGDPAMVRLPSNVPDARIGNVPSNCRPVLLGRGDDGSIVMNLRQTMGPETPGSAFSAFLETPPEIDSFSGKKGIGSGITP